MKQSRHFIVAICLALVILLVPAVGTAETQTETYMWIEVHPDQAGRTRIFILKAYGEDLQFTRDIIHVPFVSDSWDPQLRIEVEGPVSATYTPGNVQVTSTGAGKKTVKVWFTAGGQSGTGRWGDRFFSEGWSVRPPFEELGTTRVRARVSFPPGVTPDQKSNGIRIGDAKAPMITRTTLDGWQVDVDLKPGEIAVLGVGYRVRSDSLRQWMIMASLLLSLAAFCLATWTALRRRPSA